jgi:hypothetical protein
MLSYQQWVNIHGIAIIAYSWRGKVNMYSALEQKIPNTAVTTINRNHKQVRVILSKRRLSSHGEERLQSWLKVQYRPMVLSKDPSAAHEAMEEDNCSLIKWRSIMHTNEAITNTERKSQPYSYFGKPTTPEPSFQWVGMYCRNKNHNRIYFFSWLVYMKIVFYPTYQVILGLWRIISRFIILVSLRQSRSLPIPYGICGWSLEA